MIDDASDDEVVLIPTASLFSSNRLGGRSIKTEIKEEVEDIKYGVEIMSDSDNSSDGVGVMSYSVSDSEMSEEDKAVDGKVGDIYADISKKAGKDVKPSEDGTTKHSKDAPNTSSNNSVEFIKEISNDLKNGPGIMMKIASRWVDAEVVIRKSRRKEKKILQLKFWSTSKVLC